MTSLEADFALVRRYHDAHMESPFQLQADTALNRIEAQVSQLQTQVSTFDLLRFQLESQRDQLAVQLERLGAYVRELEADRGAMGLVIESQDLRLKTCGKKRILFDFGGRTNAEPRSMPAVPQRP